jgi:hypothetical protein
MQLLNILRMSALHHAERSEPVFKEKSPTINHKAIISNSVHHLLGCFLQAKP